VFDVGVVEVDQVKLDDEFSVDDEAGTSSNSRRYAEGGADLLLGLVERKLELENLDTSDEDEEDDMSR